MLCQLTGPTQEHLHILFGSFVIPYKTTGTFSWVVSWAHTGALALVSGSSVVPWKDTGRNSLPFVWAHTGAPALCFRWLCGSTQDHWHISVGSCLDPHRSTGISFWAAV